MGLFVLCKSCLSSQSESALKEISLAVLIEYKLSTCISLLYNSSDAGFEAPLPPSLLLFLSPSPFSLLPLEASPSSPSALNVLYCTREL